MLLAKYDSNQLKNDILSIKDAIMISNIRCANCDLENNNRDIESIYSRFYQDSFIDLVLYNQA